MTIRPLAMTGWPTTGFCALIAIASIPAIALAAFLPIDDFDNLALIDGVPTPGTGTAVANVAPVPLPAALWLFGAGLMGLVGVGRRRAQV